MALLATEKAIALASLGIPVFAAHHEDLWAGPKLLPRKSPIVDRDLGFIRGVLDATTDRERLQALFAKYPNALVGYSTENLILADIDSNPEKGRDGWYTVIEFGLEVPDTLTYGTPSGGSHHLYAKPEGVNLGPTQDHVLPDGRVASGIDRRAGAGAYGIWYADEVPWELTLAQPPAWLLTPNRTGTGVEFNGTPQTWLDSLGDDEPDDRVLAVIDRMRDDAPRDDMLKRQRELIGLGADGHPGVAAAIDVLRDLWMGREHVSGDPVREFDVALLDGIRKFGGTPEPEGVPDKEIAKRLAKEVTDPSLTKLFFDAGSADDRRRFIRGLAKLGYSADDIFATVWHIPLRGKLTQTKLYQEVHDLLAAPSAVAGEIPISLLTQAERDRCESIYSFVDHYCYASSINQRPWNMSYVRLSAWTILGLMFSDIAWIDIDKGLNLNLYGFQIGPSGSGKSEAMLDMYGFLQHIGRYDQISIDDDASEAGLLGAIRDRGGEVVWFHGDEAERVLSKMKDDAKVTWGGLQGTLTMLYDTGYVPKQLRARSSKETSREDSVHVRFNVWLAGTSKNFFDNLTLSQVEKGFIARFISAFGEKPERSPEDLKTRRRQTKDASIRDPHLAALAEELNEVRQMLSTGRGGMVPTDEAMERMDEARITALSLFEGDPLWEVIEPNVLRISFVMWKAAGLNAISQGRKTIEVDDVLIALRASEEWLTNSVTLMRGVRGNEFASKVEKVYAEIAKSGSISAQNLTQRIYGSMALSMMELKEATDNLAAQGRIRLDKGVWRVSE